jgi:hypothetical protein
MTRRNRAGLRITAVLILAAGAALLYGAKKSKTPTQPDIVAECIFVTQIQSHGIFSSYLLDAIVTSQCKATATIFLTLGYFDKEGQQYADGMDEMILAAGAHRRFANFAPDTGLLGPKWSSSRIISVKQYQK